jgi:hypothetical protein
LSREPLLENGSIGVDVGAQLPARHTAIPDGPQQIPAWSNEVLLQFRLDRGIELCFADQLGEHPSARPGVEVQDAPQHDAHVLDR